MDSDLEARVRESERQLQEARRGLVVDGEVMQQGKSPTGTSSQYERIWALEDELRRLQSDQAEDSQ